MIHYAAMAAGWLFIIILPLLALSACATAMGLFAAWVFG